MGEKDLFKQSLNNFINDFASGDAIRHLADKGYTVAQIVGMLDYPTPESHVAEVVWKHYIDTGKVSLNEPANTSFVEKITYERRQGAYERMGMKQVVTRVPVPNRKYVVVDYGKRMYKDKQEFLQSLSVLDKDDRDYILGLPWSLQSVYHELDERMERIRRVIR